MIATIRFDSSWSLNYIYSCSYIRADLRGQGRLMRPGGDALLIKSSCVPQFFHDTLYLRGTSRHYDRSTDLCSRGVVLGTIGRLIAIGASRQNLVTRLGRGHSIAVAIPDELLRYGL